MSTRRSLRSWLARAARPLALAALLVVPVVAVPGVAVAQGGWGDDMMFGNEDTPSSKELAMPEGPSDQVVFLRAIPDKTAVTVGEQVTVSVYLYYRVAYEMSERNDPKYADFLRFSLLSDPGTTQPIYTRVKGERYGARLVERSALIPLRAGKLSTGQMSARFKGRNIGARVLKTANDVLIDVTEPPQSGRPPGYVVGDTGKFTIKASVSPRRGKQGGSIAVSVKVEGMGNVPTSLRVPDVDGVKWLDPNRRDGVVGRNGKVAGSRVFEYVVRLDHAGTINLGTIELPFFDPATKKYDVAKAELGTIEVEESAPSDAEVERAKRSGKDKGLEDPLAELPAPRATLSAFRASKEKLLPSFVLGLGVGVPPLLALLVLGAARARRAAQDRGDTGDGQLKSKLKHALADAAKGEKSGDGKLLLGGIERALHAALELATGVKTRALRLDELPAQLTEHGLSKELAKEARELLEACDGLRYAPSEDAGKSELFAKTKSLTKKLTALA